MASGQLVPSLCLMSVPEGVPFTGEGEEEGYEGDVTRGRRVDPGRER